MITIIEKFKINKMNKEHLEKYLVLNFDKLSPKLKEFAILKYGNFVLKEHRVENYSIEIKNLKNIEIHGFCCSKEQNIQDSEKIVLNKYDFYYKNLFEIVGTVYHEVKHAIQNNFLDVSKNSNFEYAKKLNYCKNKTNVDINFCNLHLKNTSLHLRINKVTEDFTTKSEIFYHLNISEREAFLEEEYQYELLKQKYNYDCPFTYNIQKSIKNFNEIYHCNLSQQEIFDIIDICYENLIENKLPPRNDKGNLIATVMYDMCLVSGYDSGQLDRKEIINLSTLQEKQRMLAKEDYLIYGTVYDGYLFSSDMQDKFVENPELLSNLTETEQNANTFMIWKVIARNSDRNKDYFNALIKDKDTFFQHIVEDDNAKEMCSELLTKIFGEDFTKYLNEKETEKKR